jgi:hypothetical protein
LYQVVENSWITHCQIRQGFAIEGYVGELKAVHEFAVTQAPLATGRIDSDDPQPAELPLADLAIAEGVNSCPDQGNMSLFVQVVAGLPVTLGEMPQSFAPPGLWSLTTCTYHRGPSLFTYADVPSGRLMPIFPSEGHPFENTNYTMLALHQR